MQQLRWHCSLACSLPMGTLWWKIMVVSSSDGKIFACLLLRLGGLLMFILWALSVHEVSKSQHVVVHNQVYSWNGRDCYMIVVNKSWIRGFKWGFNGALGGSFLYLIVIAFCFAFEGCNFLGILVNLLLDLINVTLKSLWGVCILRMNRGCSAHI